MKKLLISLCFSLCSLGLFAQGSMIMYPQQNIPQSIYSNPANQFNGKIFIGVPALSSLDVRISNRFRYSDAIVKENDSLKLSFDNLLAEMKENNYLNLDLRADIISFGYSINENTQLTFNISEVISASFAVNKDLVEFIYKGNAAFENRTANFENLGINASHYREVGVGISHQFSEKWRLGGRVKYLYGLENIYTERMDVRLSTDPETYELKAITDFALNTSGIDFPNSFDEYMADYLDGKNNHGLAFDLGAHYQLNERINLSFSVIDWGFIRWNDNNTNYSGEGVFTYDGIEINSITGENELLGGEISFDRVLDSLEEELGIVESSEAYTAPMVTQLYLGGSLEIDKYSQAGILLRTDIFSNKLRPSFSLNYHRQMNKWLSLTGAYSGINGTFDNIGLGITANPGKVQFYLMTDNIIGAFQPQHARNLHTRFGMNIFIGRQKDGPKADVAKRKTRKSSKSIKNRNRGIKKSDF